MHRRTRWMAAVLMTALVTGAGVSGCASAPSSKTAAGESPAKVEKIGDTGLSRLTLTEKAVERLAIATVPVTEGQAAPPTPGEPAPPPGTFKVIP
ncbi:MAG: hypothetical protein L0K86_20365, partial [Actinomycetia bacterium]|nr:hypothetical protein [Actinomycetes bacterium]